MSPSLASCFTVLASIASATEPTTTTFSPIVVAAVEPFQMIETSLFEALPPAPPSEPQSEQTPSPLPEQSSEQLPQPTSEQTLTFGIVAESVYNHFPVIRQATQARVEAFGDTISARGEFDDKLEAFTINQPLGFYENYRHGISVKSPVSRNGGELSAGYRIGDGNFEPWYGERETDEGGEFELGAILPLAQNRDVDVRRTQLRVALLTFQQTQPQLFDSILQSQREAIEFYWAWVGAGLQLRIQRELQSLAEDRVAQIDRQITEGDLAKIVGIDNKRLLAGREIKRVEADAKAGQAAYKLSLYFRDETGRPQLPPLSSVPHDLPGVDSEPLDTASVIAAAVQRRPELDVLRLEEQKLNAELQLAANQMLPTIDLGLGLSQDVGGQTSSKGDKQPLTAEAALIGSVPIQRRKAIGKQRALRAKIAQLDAKFQLMTEKIGAEIGQAIVARNAAAQRVEQAKSLVDLARQTLAAGSIAFEGGDIDILLLNIYEQSLADAESSLVAAEVDYFVAEGLRHIAAGELPGQNFDFPTDTSQHVDDFILMKP